MPRPVSVRRTVMPGVLLALCCVSVPAVAADRVSSEQLFSCLAESRAPQAVRRFAWDGICKTPEQDDACYYQDFRERDLADRSGVDQRGLRAFQLTFPTELDRWAALAVNESTEDRFCWSGGAMVGRNPIGMSWGGKTGGKRRINNFIRNEGGLVQVDGARVHNTHDTFSAETARAGFDIRHAWTSYTRDDFFEGHLNRLSIRDTLVDGTYNFLSGPDDCAGNAAVREAVVTIEDSLIRLERQPGPYARADEKWHWKVDGGHHELWKTEGCGWSRFPKYVLRNNVFLIEGPMSNFETLYRAACSLGLPGACDSPRLDHVEACENNLYLYTDYRHWTDAGTTPGPTPQPGDRFHNPRNPEYKPNGADCYQRMTDDRRDSNYGPVLETWRSRRSEWIARHAGSSSSKDRVMKIAGVDYPVFGSGSRLQLENMANGRCLQSEDDGRLRFASCANIARQRFQPRAYRDGRFAGAVLLVDHRGRMLRTQDPAVVERANSDRALSRDVFTQSGDSDRPGFDERWYLWPLSNEPGGQADEFAVESDAPRRSYIGAAGDRPTVQPLFESGTRTATPHRAPYAESDAALRWRVRER